MSHICGHCEGPMRGYAFAFNLPLCHPDAGPDCYHLVTVYRHPMPCASCPGEVGMRSLGQALNLDVNWDDAPWA